MENSIRMIEERLVELFSNGEWITTRKYFRRVEDRNPFISASIISILDKCTIQSKKLINTIEKSKYHIKSYQKDHLTFHWPLKNGKSMMPNSTFLGKLKSLELSPDADCSVLQQIAINNPKHIKNLVSELEFYRYDNDRFKLSKQQSEISENVYGSFLTWFPPKEHCHSKKIETVDIVVQSNILWFLGQNDLKDTKGVSETRSFIVDALFNKTLMTNPYRFSPYYPFLSVILYSIVRVAVWGNYSFILNYTDKITELALQVEINNSTDLLCLMSIEKLLNINLNLPCFEIDKLDRSPFYALAFTEAFHSLEWLSRRSVAQMTFESEALKLAMLRWIKED